MIVLIVEVNLLNGCRFSVLLEGVIFLRGPTGQRAAAIGKQRGKISPSLPLVFYAGPGKAPKGDKD